MKNDHPPAYKHKIWWMGNKESSLPGLIVFSGMALHSGKSRMYAV